MDFKFGRFTLADGKDYAFSNNHKIILKTATDVYDADWKTALVHNKPIIPKGAEVEWIDFFHNFYGTYFYVKYNGEIYSAEPYKFAYIE